MIEREREKKNKRQENKEKRKIRDNVFDRERDGRDKINEIMDLTCENKENKVKENTNLISSKFKCWPKLVGTH